ncbi:MAG: hypothetical protein JWM99_35 [Verrucomicrobiales bacterium]|nr:hypothetical protein [Verrucomicrobiales bacterium]
MAAKEIQQVSEHLALLAKFRVRDGDVAIAHKIAMRIPKEKAKSRPPIRTSSPDDLRPKTSV